MSNTPDGCAGCGKPTQSHHLRLDVSHLNDVGLPVLACVVCHTCWTGDTPGVPNIGRLQESGDEEALFGALEIDRMVAVSGVGERRSRKENGEGGLL
jgi:hypothetical protein